MIAILFDCVHGESIVDIELSGNHYLGICGGVTVETDNILNFEKWNDGDIDDEVCEGIIAYDADSGTSYNMKEVFGY